MKNYSAICTIARSIIKTCEKVETLTNACLEIGTQGDDDLAGMYNEQLLGEVADLQQLTLRLTGITLPEDSDDVQGDEGSVFAEGELNAVKGEENTDCGAGDDQK